MRGLALLLLFFSPELFAVDSPACKQARDNFNIANMSALSDRSSCNMGCIGRPDPGGCRDSCQRFYEMRMQPLEFEIIRHCNPSTSGTTTGTSGTSTSGTTTGTSGTSTSGTTTGTSATSTSGTTTGTSGTSTSGTTTGTSGTSTSGTTTGTSGTSTSGTTTGTSATSTSGTTTGTSATSTSGTTTGTSGTSTSGNTTGATTPRPTCDRTRQPMPHWGEKNGKCIKSCGGIGGDLASGQPCWATNADDVGEAYDTKYCCKRRKAGSVNVTCDPINEPYPDFQVKNGKCAKSCGALGGTRATDTPCENLSLEDAGSAWDVKYCCRERSKDAPPPQANSVCNPNEQPSPHWGERNGKCMKSCGALGGNASSDRACERQGMEDVGMAYDVTYCCKIIPRTPSDDDSPDSYGSH